MQAKIAQDTFTFQGSSLETAPEALGELRRSDDAHGGSPPTCVGKS